MIRVGYFVDTSYPPLTFDCPEAGNTTDPNVYINNCEGKDISYLDLIFRLLNVTWSLVPVVSNGDWGTALELVHNGTTMDMWLDEWLLTAERFALVKYSAYVEDAGSYVYIMQNPSVNGTANFSLLKPLTGTVWIVSLLTFATVYVLVRIGAFGTVGSILYIEKLDQWMKFYHRSSMSSMLFGMLIMILSILIQLYASLRL